MKEFTKHDRFAGVCPARMIDRSPPAGEVAYKKISRGSVELPIYSLKSSVFELRRDITDRNKLGKECRRVACKVGLLTFSDFL